MNLFAHHASVHACCCFLCCRQALHVWFSSVLKPCHTCMSPLKLWSWQVWKSFLFHVFVYLDQSWHTWKKTPKPKPSHRQGWTWENLEVCPLPLKHSSSDYFEHSLFGDQAHLHNCCLPGRKTLGFACELEGIGKGEVMAFVSFHLVIKKFLHLLFLDLTLGVTRYWFQQNECCAAKQEWNCSKSDY